MTDNQYKTLILGNPVERFEGFTPIGWYGQMGFSFKRTRWQKFLGTLYYYRFRNWLGLGKSYQRCACEDEEWDWDEE